MFLGTKNSDLLVGGLWRVEDMSPGCRTTSKWVCVTIYWVLLEVFGEVGTSLNPLG